jgi:hypothetical protein
MMNGFTSSAVLSVALVALSLSTSGCGLVKAPFRVAGALTNAGYKGGKKVVKSSSDALERRQERKEKEKAAEAKKPAAVTPATGPSESLIPTANPQAEGPIIPLPTPEPAPEPAPMLPPD